MSDLSDLIERLVVEAVLLVPDRCVERHYGPPQSHAGCLRGADVVGIVAGVMDCLAPLLAVVEAAEELSDALSSNNAVVGFSSDAVWAAKRKTDVALSALRRGREERG